MRIVRLLPLAAAALAFSACSTPYDQGMQAFTEGKWKESIEYFSEVKGWDDHSDDAADMIAKACFHIGKQAVEDQRWDEALEYLPKAKANRAEAKKLIGLAHLGRGKQAMGASDWSAAINDFLLVRPECSEYQQARDLLARAKKMRDG